MIENFHLNSKYFPPSTKDLFDVDAILKFGALALGTKSAYRFFKKCKWLNVGMVDPKNKAAIAAIESRVKSLPEFTGIKLYKVDAGEFLQVVKDIYQVEPGSLTLRSDDKLENTLRSYLLALGSKENEAIPAP